MDGSSIISLNDEVSLKTTSPMYGVVFKQAALPKSKVDFKI